MGFVLAIAIDRHQHVVVVSERELERAAGSTVALVLLVPHDLNVAASRQPLASAVGRTIVDDQHVGAVAQYLVEYAIDVIDFVENRQGG